MFMVGQTSKGSHGANFGRLTGSACLERKETSHDPMNMRYDHRYVVQVTVPFTSYTDLH